MCIDKQNCQCRNPNDRGLFVCIKKRHEFCPEEDEEGDEKEDGDGVDELDFGKD